MSGMENPTTYSGGMNSRSQDPLALLNRAKVTTEDILHYKEKFNLTLAKMQSANRWSDECEARDAISYKIIVLAENIRGYNQSPRRNGNMWDLRNESVEGPLIEARNALAHSAEHADTLFEWSSIWKVVDVTCPYILPILEKQIKSLENQVPGGAPRPTHDKDGYKIRYNHLGVITGGSSSASSQQPKGFRTPSPPKTSQGPDWSNLRRTSPKQEQLPRKSSAEIESPRAKGHAWQLHACLEKLSIDPSRDRADSGSSHSSSGSNLANSRRFSSSTPQTTPATSPIPAQKMSSETVDCSVQAEKRDALSGEQKPGRWIPPQKRRSMPA